MIEWFLGLRLRWQIFIGYMAFGIISFLIYWITYDALGDTLSSVVVAWWFVGSALAIGAFLQKGYGNVLRNWGCLLIIFIGWWAPICALGFGPISYIVAMIIADQQEPSVEGSKRLQL